MGVEALCALQDRLYAQDRWGVLLIFQAMDAAGKDGAIKHVMSGVNPQGCQVASFKAPSAQDLDHDYLWRCQSQLPERGRIGIFNRSYYEEVLVVRVHPEILEKQKIPSALLGKDVFEDRYRDIRAFERYLSERNRRSQVLPPRVPQGTEAAFPRAARGPGEELEVLGQRPRRARVLEGVHEGVRGDDPLHRHARCPLYVVPADNKWYTRVVVARAVVDALASLDLEYPKVGKRQLAELGKAREALLAEK